MNFTASFKRVLFIISHLLKGAKTDEREIPILVTLLSVNIVLFYKALL